MWQWLSDFMILCLLKLKSLLFKIESVSASGDLWNLMESSFLSGRFQRVLLNGQLSDGLVLKVVFFKAQI